MRPLCKLLIFSNSLLESGTKFYDPMAENKVMANMLEALEELVKNQGYTNVRIMSQ